ncbi:Uncharacterised protein [Mycobacteroides abscessus subsp. abscessus]|nr:Uncharacterised protein [Mycobacteroides abscessus subsp. abscessus]
MFVRRMVPQIGGDVDVRSRLDRHAQQRVPRATAYRDGLDQLVGVAGGPRPPHSLRQGTSDT